jgi:hypothetical protein
VTVDATATTTTRAAHAETTDETILARFSAMAKQLPPNAVAQRVAMGDVAYPRNEQENQAMGGFALLLVTTVARDEEELPLRRVVLHLRTRDIDLPKVAAKPAIVRDPLVSSAYGAARSDELYLLPVFATRVPAIISIDLAHNRKDLRVLEFPVAPQDDALPPEVVVRGDVEEPQHDALKKLAEEEFHWSTLGVN